MSEIEEIVARGRQLLAGIEKVRERQAEQQRLLAELEDSARIMAAGIDSKDVAKVRPMLRKPTRHDAVLIGVMFILDSGTEIEVPGLILSGLSDLPKTKMGG